MYFQALFTLPRLNLTSSQFSSVRWCGPGFTRIVGFAVEIGCGVLVVWCRRVIERWFVWCLFADESRKTVLLRQPRTRQLGKSPRMHSQLDK